MSVSREPTMTLRKRCPNRSTAIHSQPAFFLNPHTSAFHPSQPRQVLPQATHQGVPVRHTVLSADKPQRVGSSELPNRPKTEAFQIQCQCLAFDLFAIPLICHRVPVATALTAITLSSAHDSRFGAGIMLTGRTSANHFSLTLLLQH